VSVLRPRQRVTDPDGREWELYVYRLRVRSRGATYDPGLAPDDIVGGQPAASTYVQAEAALGVLDAVLWGVGLIPRLLVRVFWDIPAAALRVPGSSSWTIEAVSWYPQRTSRSWTTSVEWRDETLAEIADSIRRGVLPRPEHAAADPSEPPR
jgi:hypothetical protein